MEDDLIAKCRDLDARLKLVEGLLNLDGKLQMFTTTHGLLRSTSLVPPIPITAPDASAEEYQKALIHERARRAELEKRLQEVVEENQRLRALKPGDLYQLPSVYTPTEVK